jgi:hypothetical protein
MSKISVRASAMPPFSRSTLTPFPQVGDYVRLKDGHEREYSRGYGYRDEEDEMVSTFFLVFILLLRFG